MKIEKQLTGLKMYDKLETLKQVKIDAVNWVTYYFDESTCEKWIEEHPYPEMHAGGPAQLMLLDKFPWE